MSIKAVTTITYGWVPISIFKDQYWLAQGMNPIVHIRDHLDQMLTPHEHWMKYPVLCNAIKLWCDSKYYKQMTLQEFITKLGV